MLMFFSFSFISPSLEMETTGSGSAEFRTWRTLGTSTSRPNSITCAVSMKIIRTTSTTSTSGMMLISAIAP